MEKYNYHYKTSSKEQRARILRRQRERDYVRAEQLRLYRLESNQDVREAVQGLLGLRNNMYFS